MPIEVRQLVIKSTVGDGQAHEGKFLNRDESLAQLKEELLAECRAWFLEQLRQGKER